MMEKPRDSKMPESLEAPAVPEDFHVQDEASANWVMRKIQEARAYAARVEEWAEAEKRRAQREEDFFMLRFGDELQRFAERTIAGLKGRKSISLPAGRLGFRQEQGRLRVVDEPVLLDWARAHTPSAITVELRIDGCLEAQLEQWLSKTAPEYLEDAPALRRQVSKTAINEHFKETGEIPEGVEYDPGSTKFYVK